VEAIKIIYEYTGQKIVWHAMMLD